MVESTLCGAYSRKQPAFTVIGTLGGEDVASPDSAIRSCSDFEQVLETAETLKVFVASD